MRSIGKTINQPRTLLIKTIDWIRTLVTCVFLLSSLVTIGGMIGLFMGKGSEGILLGGFVGFICLIWFLIEELIKWILRIIGK